MDNWRCSHGWLRGKQCEICNAPKREWVGLTDEDTFDIAIQIGIDVTLDDEDSIYIFCKAIQAALKEKNFD